MPGPVFADGERLALHTEEWDDLETLTRLRNDPDVRRPLTMFYPQNRHQAEQEFEQYSDDDSAVGFVVCRQGDDGDTTTASGDTDADGETTDTDPEIVGVVVTFAIDDRLGQGLLAYWIRPEHQGNGYAREASALLLDHLFGERGLHKVEAYVLATNEPSQRVLESLGFEPNGRLRESNYVHGEYVDTFHYTLLEDQWDGPAVVMP